MSSPSSSLEAGRANTGELLLTDGVAVLEAIVELDDGKGIEPEGRSVGVPVVEELAAADELPAARENQQQFTILGQAPGIPLLAFSPCLAEHIFLPRISCSRGLAHTAPTTTDRHIAHCRREFILALQEGSGRRCRIPGRANGFCEEGT